MLRLRRFSTRLLLLLPLLAMLVPAAAEAQRHGEMKLTVVDQHSGEPIAVRMHLKDARGRSIKPPGVPYWKDHFVFDGTINLELAPGNYTFEMERGPEYRVRTGYIILERGAKDSKQVDMQRYVDMKKEGWWSGELHIHRPLEDIELLMRAEDLHVGPVITWWNERNPWEGKPLPEPLLVRFDENRYYHKLAGEDERGGGALLYFNLQKPLPLAGSEREYPSPVEFLKQARQQGLVHVDIEKPFWWDMPVWVASGLVDSIGLNNNHMWRTGMLTNEAWGKPRDKVLYPDPLGNGRWSQDIYYHLLNCGLRIPPSAGSASGVLNNPVGYNRVYVHCGDKLDYGQWWEGLRQGRVTVTNGPLLRPLVNGELPGHVFHAAAGEKVTLNITLNISMREPVEYLEIVKDGQVVHEVRLEKYVEAGGRLPEVEFDQSGWMLIRAVTTNAETYRVGSTGPYYVDIGSEPRISKRSAQFFLDWVHERARQLNLQDPEKRESVIRYHRAARDFWQERVERANAE